MFQNFQKLNRLNKLNRGVSAPIAILVIVAVTVVCGGLALWQYSEIQKETVITPFSEIQFPESSPAASTEDIISSPDTEIDTSDWKTYRNEEIGFEFEYPKEIFGDIEELRFSKNNSSIISSGEKIELSFTTESSIIFFARTLDFEYNIPPSMPFAKNDSDIKCQHPLTLTAGKSYYCGRTMCKPMEIAGEKAIFEICASNYECCCDVVASIYLINLTKSKYKSLEFRISLEDTEKKICSGFSCLEKTDTSIIDLWCRNLLLGRGLPAEDEKRLNLFKDIISSFRFIEE